MKLDEATLLLISSRGEKLLPGLETCIEKFHLNTPDRMAAFLGQVSCASNDFRYVKEIWGPSVWQQGYEGNKTLGNTHRGDGARYIGRGYLPIVGRLQYSLCSMALFNSKRLLDSPESLEQPMTAILSAGWVWYTKRLNHLADIWDINRISRHIPAPSSITLEERLRMCERARKILQGIAEQIPQHESKRTLTLSR